MDQSSRRSVCRIDVAFGHSPRCFVSDFERQATDRAASRWIAGPTMRGQVRTNNITTSLLISFLPLG